MIISIASLVAGILLILKGADWLTEGASSVALRFQVSTLVIGLTVVAFGTSMPEFVISMISALKGSSDLSIGNIVGSNIFNVLAIVGTTAVVTPIAIQKGTLLKDIPFAILGALVLAVAALDNLVDGGTNTISRSEGLLMLGFFAVFMAYTFSIAKNDAGEEDMEIKARPMWRSLLLIVGGLAGLILGGQWFVDGAQEIAMLMGVSESVIGLTIVAAGTSAPELATSVVAARKGSSGMAIGNVIGSCLFNIFWVLGVCCTLTPMPVGDISTIDLSVMVGSLLLLWFCAATSYKVTRKEGLVMLFLFVAYMTWLVVNS